MFRFLLMTQFAKQVQNFTGDPNSTIFAWSSFNQHADYKFSKESWSYQSVGNVQEYWLSEGKIKRCLWNLQNMFKFVLWVLMMILLIDQPTSTAFYMKKKIGQKFPKMDTV
jgi:hypothetical protein